MTVCLAEASWKTKTFLLQHSPVFFTKKNNLEHCLPLYKSAVQISHTSEALKHNLPTRFIKTHLKSTTHSDTHSKLGGFSLSRKK